MGGGLLCWQRTHPIVVNPRLADASWILVVVIVAITDLQTLPGMARLDLRHLLMGGVVRAKSTQFFHARRKVWWLWYLEGTQCLVIDTLSIRYILKLLAISVESPRS
jgi:hypothetical protein